MRRDRAWIVVIAGGIAVAACARRSLTGDDAGASGGLSGAIGTDGQAGGGAVGAGAGGQGASAQGVGGQGAGGAGSGGQGAGGVGVATGTGGLPGCTAADQYTTCTPDAGAPPSSPTDNGACSVEGGTCKGYACHDSVSGGTWQSTCCAGRWRPYYSGACPPPPQPGDPFACSGDLTCAAFQSYCLNANPDRTAAPSSSCQPLCAAGDCTCFCDKPDGCTFKPPGSNCPADLCTCGITTVGPGIPQLGAIQVQCHYLVAGTGGCYGDASLVGQCGGLSFPLLCEGPREDLGANCTPVPDSVITASCGTEIHDYCCDS